MQRTRDLQDYIRTGRIIEAMEEFYAEDVVMQDDSEEPTRGRSANIERERAWLDSVAEFKSFDVTSIAVEGDTSFVESSMDFVTKDGQAFHLEQVARAVWKGDRIVSERFYRA